VTAFLGMGVLEDREESDGKDRTLTKRLDRVAELPDEGGRGRRWGIEMANEEQASKPRLTKKKANARQWGADVLHQRGGR